MNESTDLAERHLHKMWIIISVFRVGYVPEVWLYDLLTVHESECPRKCKIGITLVLSINT